MRSQTNSRAAGSRPVHHRPGDHDPLGLAARHEVDLVGRPVGQAEQLEELVGAAVALGRRHAVIGGVEGQVLADRERAVEVGRCGTTASMLRARTASAVTSMPTTRTTPAVSRTRVVSTPIVVVLPGAIWAQEPEYLAPLDGEGDAVDRVHRGLRVALLEPLDLDCQPLRHRS
jgi:hypothetical protein